MRVGDVEHDVLRRVHDLVEDPPLRGVRDDDHASAARFGFLDVADRLVEHHVVNRDGDDRQVVVATFPQLQAEWGLSDAQLGALVSVVSVTVGLGAFPAALLVDRWSRVRAIALMGTVWSLAAAAADDAVLMLGAGETVIGQTDAFVSDADCRGLYLRAPARPERRRAAS